MNNFFHECLLSIRLVYDEPAPLKEFLAILNGTTAVCLELASAVMEGIY